MADIFLSYRRSDAGGHAGRLFDRLRKRVGARGVFFDVASIAGGERWRDSLQAHLQRCRVVLVVIGPDWFGARDERGALRLGQADDVVRAEIAEAERAGKVLIPVLVGGAELPPPDTLPPDWPAAIREIGAHQVMRIDHDEFESDALKLEQRLAAVLPGLELVPLDGDSLSAQTARLTRALAWPLGLALALTWATDALFRQLDLEGLVAHELAFVFVVCFVPTYGVFAGVRRRLARGHS